VTQEQAQWTWTPNAENNTLTINSFAALLDWWDIIPENNVPPISPLLLNPKDVEAHHLNTTRQCKNWWMHCGSNSMKVFL
jgi:hypothetical protein